LFVGRGFFMVMQIFTALAAAVFAIGAKQGFKLGKQIGGRAKVAEIFIALFFRLGGFLRISNRS
jgi:hypothetical protein